MKERRIEIKPVSKIQRKHIDHGRMIYLTFDDGPDPEGTGSIINVLAQNQVKATFFLIGRNIAKYPEMLEKLIQDDHAIGNHGYSHKSLHLQSFQQVKKEISKTDELLWEHAKIKTRLFRPPYLRLGLWVFNPFFRSEKQVIMASLNPKDFKSNDPHTLSDYILKKIKPGDIVVLHDRSDMVKNTIQALKTLIPELLNRGYKFGKLDQIEF
ncbi:MAG: polysaccharide deacetylase family protein [Candidatus Cloacimonetes bacterium]|nr:polysaccharide deacetylase family protein [Candidatus Cloacimonadota bacterium]